MLISLGILLQQILNWNLLYWVIIITIIIIIINIIAVINVHSKIGLWNRFCETDFVKQILGNLFNFCLLVCMCFFSALFVCALSYYVVFILC
jgi:hypothetical protein